MGRPTKYNPKMLITVYLHARDGKSNHAIAGLLEIESATFGRWIGRHPALRDALERGRDGGPGRGGGTFADHVYLHLPDELKEVWQSIKKPETAQLGIERIEAMTDRYGIRARQHLFLYALVNGNFQLHAALKKMNIPLSTFNTWKREDDGFAALVDELLEYKRVFIEDAFLRQIQAGNTAAVLHGVKTLCSDMGYGEKMKIEHSGQVETGPDAAFNILDLDLSLACKAEILKAIDDRQKALETEQVAPGATA